MPSDEKRVARVWKFHMRQEIRQEGKMTNVSNRRVSSQLADIAKDGNIVFTISYFSCRSLRSFRFYVSSAFASIPA